MYDARAGRKTWQAKRAQLHADRSQESQTLAAAADEGEPATAASTGETGSVAAPFQHWWQAVLDPTAEPVSYEVIKAAVAARDSCLKQQRQRRQSQQQAQFKQQHEPRSAGAGAAPAPSSRSLAANSSSASSLTETAACSAGFASPAADILQPGDGAVLSAGVGGGCVAPASEPCCPIHPDQKLRRRKNKRDGQNRSVNLRAPLLMLGRVLVLQVCGSWAARTSTNQASTVDTPNPRRIRPPAMRQRRCPFQHGPLLTPSQ
jgi:hypothetical protein